MPYTMHEVCAHLRAKHDPHCAAAADMLESFFKTAVGWQNVAAEYHDTIVDLETKLNIKTPRDD